MLYHVHVLHLRAKEWPIIVSWINLWW